MYSTVYSVQHAVQCTKEIYSMQNCKSRTLLKSYAVVTEQSTLQEATPRSAPLSGRLGSIPEVLIGHSHWVMYSTVCATLCCALLQRFDSSHILHCHMLCIHSTASISVLLHCAVCAVIPALNTVGVVFTVQYRTHLSRNRNLAQEPSSAVAHSTVQ